MRCSSEGKNSLTKQKRTTRRVVRRILLVLLAAFLIYVIATTASLVSFAKKDEKQKADVAIVLGASVHDNDPSPVFRERIEHAITLYNEGYVDAIIMTGGVGEGNIRSEADIAREYAERRGVPADAIYLEETSHVTRDNLRNAKQIMEEQGMETALVVSDPLHMKRAITMARDLGMTAYSSPTPTTMYRTWKTKLPFLLREETFYIAYRVARFFRMLTGDLAR